MKLVGGDAPVLLAADATVTEVSAWWIICRATELTFRSAVGPGGAHPHYALEADRWAVKGEIARKGLMRLHGARKVA